MKLASMAVLLLLVSASVAAPQKKSSGPVKGRQRVPLAANDERLLKVAEKHWAEAFKNRDREALNHLLDERFILGNGLIPPNATLIFEVELLGVK